ncbi:hypothetical protein HYC85_019716 [Camellia sinensis]|uniref:Strictosidine synthase conserved region domain-containing protein n=1 Tax=Camellia sinensis TaxID=4442 RepID=A0A7J7GRL4_CAMSI|nr:hypothetical protein HYC85_019716 [Camellia sinensis]
MEKRSQLKDEFLLQHPYLLVLALALGFIIMDPFQMSPVGGHKFRPVKNDIAPYKLVMENWPKDNMSRLSLGNLEFVDEIFGPESLEFDIWGHGPYTGTEKLCARGVDSTTSKQWKVEPWCGRPLGLRFDKKRGDLYIADAYYGLLVVGPEGGVATPLATRVEGKPIFFANDLDIHNNGSIFFTDTRDNFVKFHYRNHFLILLEGEASGRLLRYDPPTRTTHVVLDGLAFPNGVQLSKDQSFLLFTETTNCRY